MSRIFPRFRLPALVVVAALTVTACGSEGEGSQAGSSTTSAGSSATATPSETVPAGLPDCAAVWRDGERLPRVYRGCLEGGEYVEPDALDCSSGQRIIRYADGYYAVPGGTVHATTASLEKDRGYRSAVLRCRA